MLEKVIENWTSRLDYIRASRGSPVPEIIFKMAANLEPVHSSPSFNHKAAFQPFQNGLFHLFTPTPTLPIAHDVFSSFLALSLILLIQRKSTTLRAGALQKNMFPAFVSKCLIVTPSLHVPTTNQVVLSSPPRTATPSVTINNYDMGWRLVLRAICPATDSDKTEAFSIIFKHHTQKHAHFA
ncbi:hypothetical protein TNCV_3668711 [Trichonephila clavipes]|nr:hypothetical protein TNCV_3668711 [Trichonephila clavipes]